MDRVALIGDRLFMKFPDHSYFAERLQEVPAELISTEGMSETEIESALETAAAIVTIGEPVSRDRIAGAPACRFIMTLSVGYDVVDVAAATERKIAVSNCPAYCSEDVADHAVSLMLSLYRKIAELDRHTHGSGWDYKQARPIHRLSSSTVGIVGLGRIGRQSAQRAQGLGMNVIAYDPYLDDDMFATLGIERAYNLHEMLPGCDAVTIHTPLTDETWHLFDADALARMKPTACLINTARGGIVDRGALEEALRDGVIAAAGLDVLEVEPPRGDEPIFTLPNAVITPHIAWYSEESHQQNMRDGMDELVRALRGERPRHLVNPKIFARR